MTARTSFLARPPTTAGSAGRRTSRPRGAGRRAAAPRSRRAARNDSGGTKIAMAARISAAPSAYAVTSAAWRRRRAAPRARSRRPPTASQPSSGAERPGHEPDPRLAGRRRRASPRTAARRAPAPISAREELGRPRPARPPGPERRGSPPNVRRRSDGQREHRGEERRATRGSPVGAVEVDARCRRAPARRPAAAAGRAARRVAPARPAPVPMSRKRLMSGRGGRYPAAA